MKKTILCALVLTAFLNFSVLAQKEMLTKEETINYLNKKIKEAEGLNEIIIGRKVYTVRFWDLSVQMKGDDVEVKYKRKMLPNQTTEDLTYLFNPSYIQGFSVDKDRTAADSAVKRLFIGFSSKVVKTTLGTYVAEPGSGMWFPFFASVPDNDSKIAKALEHLRDLAKAEDDPFGN